MCLRRPADVAVADAIGETDSSSGTLDVKSDGVSSADAKSDEGVLPDAAAQAPGSDGPAEVANQSTADAFVPEPVEPLVVNSGNTATYDLADGA
jgi:hypothetical protein